MDPNRPISDLLPSECRPSRALCGKLPGTFRIVVIGDSYVFGAGVHLEDALPAQLARTLGGPEVLNLGWPGANGEAYKAFIETVSRNVEFDFLLLCVSADDAHPWQGQDVARCVADWRESWERQWEPANLGHFSSTLREIAESRASDGAGFAVAFYQTTSAETDEPLALRSLRAICAEHGIAFIDLATPFTRFDAARTCVSPIDSHPSTFAHRIAAVEVARALRPLLPARKEVTDAERDVLLAEQIGALAAADAAQPAGVGSTMAHVNAQLGALDATARREAAALRRALEITQWTAAAVASEQDLRRELDPIIRSMTALEQRMRLAASGIEGARGELPVREVLTVVQDTILGIRSGIASVRGALGTAPATENPPTSSEVARLLAAAARDAASRSRNDAAHVLASVAHLELFCDRFSEIATAHADALVTEETVHRWRELDARLNVARRWLDTLEELRARRGVPCDLVLDITLPAAVGARTVVNLTYTMTYPRPRSLEFSHYVERDGSTHRYLYRIADGTSGRIAIGMIHWFGFGHTETVKTPTDFVKLSLRCDGVRPCEPGMLVVAPYLDPACDVGQVPPERGPPSA